MKKINFSQSMSCQSPSRNNVCYTFDWSCLNHAQTDDWTDLEKTLKMLILVPKMPHLPYHFQISKKSNK